MLDTLRNTQNSWVTKAFLAILLLCLLLLWNIPHLHTNNERDLVTSGKSTITVDTYRLALADYSLRLALASHLGRMFTPDEMQRYKIPAFVLNQLQQDVLFDEQARKMKINLSKNVIARIIGSDNIFQENGTFSRNLFLNYLQKLPVSENGLIDYYIQREKRHQLISASLSGMKVPSLFYKALAHYEEEARTADYLVISLEKEGAIADPDQKTLQKWFDINKNKFRAPEYRAVSLLSMTAAKFIKPENISADEVKAYYTQNPSRFIAPEKRTIEELRFSSREAADEAAKKITNGMSFDDLVKEEKKTLDSIKKGPLTESEIPSRIASEVFNLEKGQVSPVINDIQGPVIIRVIHITPSASVPFESAEKDIRQALAQSRAAADIRDNYMKIENARFEGASLQELADQYKLPLHKITIDKTGKTIEGVEVTNLPQKEVLLDSVYQSNEGAELDPLSLPEGGYLWYQVDTIIPSHDRALEEVKQDAITQWKSEKVQRLLDEKSQNALQKLIEGGSLDSLAHKLGTTKQKTRALRRKDSSEILGSEGVKELFSGPTGHRGIIKGAVKTNRIIYEITASITPPNTAVHTFSSDVRANMDMIIKEDLKQQMLHAANKEHPLQINGSNYNRILNSLQ
ncbi:peptidyl-prolyl cis-trans isomerase D [Bartonella australis AUST/NH1]|uniref:Parvulin-like PPIase n=1 Tax=Bartonella australis (strain Aust/NH1) TaxID=1094489 RepID=M1P3G1_BARAA|nr:peptidyl-prolyl cis-trans isomerase [Bartonella australis]AGF74370.1 peptidyl-prolyl cis-trans isomerase D [Bartonella australis AUST/NH1]